MVLEINTHETLLKNITNKNLKIIFEAVKTTLVYFFYKFCNSSGTLDKNSAAPVSGKNTASSLYGTNEHLEPRSDVP